AAFILAEDGIRVRNVTGVQTCALPILIRSDHAGVVVPMVRAVRKGVHLERRTALDAERRGPSQQGVGGSAASGDRGDDGDLRPRSDERRVGKGGRLWGAVTG